MCYNGARETSEKPARLGKEGLFVKKKYLVTQEDILPSKQYTCHLLEDVTAPLHINLEMELVVVLQGDITMQIGRGSQVIQAGEGVFVLPFETHDFNTPVESRTIVYTFSERMIREIQAFFDANRPTERVFPVPKEVSTWLLSRIPKRDEDLTFADMLGVVGPLFALITRHCRFAPKEGGTNDLFLDAISYIDRTYTQDISLAKVASALGVTDKKLSRVFFQESGIYFSDYLNMRRVSQAGVLLRAKAGNVSEVAVAVGYDNVRTFNRCFRRYFGITPTEHMQRASDTPIAPAAAFDGA